MLSTHLRRAVPVVAILLAAAACSSDGSSDAEIPGTPADATSDATTPQAGSESAPPAFEKTTWAATELGGVKVTTASSNAPHLVFDGERVSGADGCNRLTGPYTRDGQSLTFGMLAGTRMFCADAAEVEKAMRDVTTRTRGWRMDGQTLELLDESDAVLGRFEAR